MVLGLLHMTQTKVIHILVLSLLHLRRHAAHVIFADGMDISHQMEWAWIIVYPSRLVLQINNIFQLHYFTKLVIQDFFDLVHFDGANTVFVT